jgi:hypothetical protein
VYHVRHRVYLPESGRWSRRDPLGYVDGMGLYEYVKSSSILHRDPSGEGVFYCTRRVGVKLLRHDVALATMTGECPMTSEEFIERLRDYLQNDPNTQKLACEGAANDVGSTCRDRDCPPHTGSCHLYDGITTVTFVSQNGSRNRPVCIKGVSYGGVEYPNCKACVALWVQCECQYRTGGCY